METLEELFNAQFRDSWMTMESDEGHEQLNLDVYSEGAGRDDWILTTNVFNRSTIRRFQIPLNQSISGNRCVPAILQQEKEYLVLHLCCIFTACLESGHTLTAWTQVQVTFI
jgi:hypothetical protein